MAPFNKLYYSLHKNVYFIYKSNLSCKQYFLYFESLNYLRLKTEECLKVIFFVLFYFMWILNMVFQAKQYFDHSGYSLGKFYSTSFLWICKYGKHYAVIMTVKNCTVIYRKHISINDNYIWDRVLIMIFYILSNLQNITALP